MSVDSDTFRAVLGRFATGITIITGRDDAGVDHGMTVSAFSSVSLNPPLVLACIDHAASMRGLMDTLTNIGINILSEGQEAISRRFSGKDIERFDGLGYTRGVSGVALLDDALAHLEARVVDRHQAGDHLIIIAEVEAAEAFSERPLLYYRSGYAQLTR
jgi:flavin reductase (DIM6/NTAB) family NADH-FMN oxidoreductase RutF